MSPHLDGQPLVPPDTVYFHDDGEVEREQLTLFFSAMVQSRVHQGTIHLGNPPEVFGTNNNTVGCTASVIIAPASSVPPKSSTEQSKIHNSPQSPVLPPALELAFGLTFNRLQ